jgi:hypothetical protein
MKLLVQQLIKEALHAHTRGQERLKLPPKSIDAIQKETDKMWYSYGRNKLRNAFYYSPLRDNEGMLLGYATFKNVGTAPYANRLVLTTILSKEMKPRGDNIGSFFSSKIQGIYTPTGHVAPAYKGMDPVPNNQDTKK